MCYMYLPTLRSRESANERCAFRRAWKLSSCTLPVHTYIPTYPQPSGSPGASRSFLVPRTLHSYRRHRLYIDSRSIYLGQPVLQLCILLHGDHGTGPKCNCGSWGDAGHILAGQLETTYLGACLADALFPVRDGRRAMWDPGDGGAHHITSHHSGGRQDRQTAPLSPPPLAQAYIA